tara:strand:+ start:4791 stop:5273 length:483 start_codon:yes stop_codon:yes gene_type:complete
VKQAGFTLVELMIILTIMAIVAVVSVPLTSGWVDSAERLEAQGALTEAFGHARGAAIRNAMGAAGQDAVARVCLANGALRVLRGTSTAAADCATGAGVTVWQKNIDADVQITQDGTAYQCSCFDNRGLLTAAACGSCGTSFTFTLATGTADDEKETIVID